MKVELINKNVSQDTDCDDVIPIYSNYYNLSLFN